MFQFKFVEKIYAEGIISMICKTGTAHTSPQLAESPRRSKRHPAANTLHDFKLRSDSGSLVGGPPTIGAEPRWASPNRIWKFSSTFLRSLAGILMKRSNLHSESVGTFSQSEQKAAKSSSWTSGRPESSLYTVLLNPRECV